LTGAVRIAHCIDPHKESTMKCFLRRLGVTVIVAAAMAIAVAASARADSATADTSRAGMDRGVGTQVLDTMCREKGGQPFFTPFTISRCQEARSRQGFELEALVCEGLLGGRFTATDSPGRRNRTNWACISGPTE
jgi:hypothetical protein